MSKPKEIQVAHPRDVEVTIDILHQEELQKELGALKDVFRASYGPTGRLNLIQNSCGGHVTVSSTSACLLNSITSVSSPLTQLLLQAVKGHLHTFNDGGLFTGLLILELLDTHLKSSLPRHIAIIINEHALNLILSHLNMPTNYCCKIPADIGNMHQMISVVKTILATKCATGITPVEMDCLSILLLRGFLRCIPNSEVTNKSLSLESLKIHGCEGASISDSCLVQGVLLNVNQCLSAGERIHEDMNMDIKVALYDCSLAGNVDDKWFDNTKTDLLNNIPDIEHTVLVSMKNMVDQLVEKGVKLVACQKVIHPTLQRYLTKKGIYFVERLSISHIDTVQKLTGAVKLSTYQGEIGVKSFGSLASIEELVIQKKRFLHLLPHHSASCSISTLLLCGPDETSLDELQLVCSAVLRSLKHLVYHPYLVPGGGCFETHIASLLIQASLNEKLFLDIGCTKGQLYEGLHSIASAFLHISQSIDHEKYDHLVDTTFYHHWMKQPLYIDNNTKQPQNCLCHLVTSSQEIEWCRVEELVWKTEHKHEDMQSCTTLKLGNGYNRRLVFDIMKMKLNGIKTAFEIVNIILRVKHFVKEIV